VIRPDLADIEPYRWQEGWGGRRAGGRAGAPPRTPSRGRPAGTPAPPMAGPRPSTIPGLRHGPQARRSPSTPASRRTGDPHRRRRRGADPVRAARALSRRPPADPYAMFENDAAGRRCALRSRRCTPTLICTPPT
jgi:hypothetical protein